MDLIVAHVHARVEHDDAIGVVEDVVVLDPAEASFYAEDALAPRLVDEIVENDCVS